MVLVDTAGRMQNKSNLMAELEKVRRVANPHLTLFVGDALAGNDAVDRNKKFPTNAQIRRSGIDEIRHRRQRGRWTIDSPRNRTTNRIVRSRPRIR